MQHDLNNLPVIVAGSPESIEIVFTDVAALTRDFDGKMYRGSRKRIV